MSCKGAITPCYARCNQPITLYGCNHYMFRWGGNHSKFCQWAQSSIFCEFAMTPCFARMQVKLLHVLLLCNRSMFCWGVITPCFSRLQLLLDLPECKYCTSWFARAQVLLGCNHMFYRSAGNHFLFYRHAMTPKFSLETITLVYIGWETNFFYFLDSSMAFPRGICPLPISISFHALNYVFIFPQYN